MFGKRAVSVVSSLFKSQTTGLRTVQRFASTEAKSARSAAAIAHSALSDLQHNPSTLDKTLTVTFVDRTGHRHTFPAYVGQTVLDVAIENAIALRGECEGALACSTCHVIVSNEFINKLPEQTEDEEMAFSKVVGVTSNSRLGCQIVLNKNLDGLVVALPPSAKPQTIDLFITALSRQS